MLLVVELDGRAWWNSTCIQKAKALAAPYLRQGRRIVIRSHESNRDKLAICFDRASGQWIELARAD
jgi:hypothetical protein